MWYVCSYKDSDGVECQGLGSDFNFYTSYVRKDCVRKFIEYIVNKSYRHNDIVNVYKLTDTQFNHYPSYNVVKELPQCRINIDFYRK